MTPRELVLAHLDRLYVATEKHQELSEVLERRVELSIDPLEQAELYFRLAEVQITHFGDKPTGLSTLRTVVDNNPEHEGARGLLESLTDEADLFEEAAEALETCVADAVTASPGCRVASL